MSTITRRRFVEDTVKMAASAAIVPRHVLGGVGYQAPSDRLNIAVVGCGGQGASDASELIAAGENIVALADCDFSYVDASLARRTKTNDGKPSESGIALQKAFEKAHRYQDYRKMLEHKGIDAVIVGTPDHTHAPVAKAAMELGKHVYVEKPLTWSVAEARALREAARRSPKLVTQMGNQGHSSEGARLINEWIQAGVIGPVREVHVWTNRPIWPQGIPRPMAGQSAATPSAPSGWSQRQLNAEFARAMSTNAMPPSGLAWDLFLGPAKHVPYHPIYHPFNWRGWVDWGTGALGDMAAHLIDHPYWALDLMYPTSVESTSTPFGTDEKGMPASFPVATETVYRFPARGTQPAVTLTWRDGGLMPQRPPQLPDSLVLQRGGGVIMVGDKGVLVHETYGANPKVYPESLMEEAAKVPKTLPRVAEGLHRRNWAEACKGRATAVCPFEYAARLTEVMLLGVVALKTGQGKLIRYDGETGNVTNDSDANQHLGREYRQGWTL